MKYEKVSSQKIIKKDSIPTNSKITPNRKHNPQTVEIGMFLWKSYSNDWQNFDSGTVGKRVVENVDEKLKAVLGCTVELLDVVALKKFVTILTV